MARPLKATRDQVLSETRDQLLAAAAAEFAREGFAAANINRISTAAGFAKGTVYNYFASKRALVHALIDETAAIHVAAIIEAVLAEDDPVRRLEQFFRAGFAYVEQHPDRSRVVINIMYGPNEAFKQRVYDAYEPLFDLLINDVLGLGIARGVFRPLDANTTAALVMTIYVGSCSQLDSEGKIWVDATHIMPLVLDGLRCGA
jgi:AcrR family transcriptional regulator